MIRYFSIIAILSVFVSCSERPTQFSNTTEMEAYVNDPENGHILSEETNDLRFELKVIPSLNEDTTGQCTAHLRISRKDGGSVLDLGNVSKRDALEREGYLAFDLRKDVYIQENGSKIPAIFHHYERNYGLKPSVDILFNFMHVTPESDVVFTYSDALFGQGLVRIKLSKELFTKYYVKNA